MKLFWALIAVLVLVGGGFLLLAGPQQRAAEKEISRAREEAAPPSPSPLVNSADHPAQSSTPAKPAVTDRAETLASPTSTPSNSTPTPADTPVTTPAPPQAAAKLTTSEPSIDDFLAALPAVPSASKPPTASIPPKPTAKPEDPTFDILPTSIAQQDDGTSLVDGKYTIKGDGSADNPYVVPWELLTSAEHTYNPAEGKKKISEAIAMLDGKHVKLNGFIAFPMMVQQPRELLSMLNQWDGCCIGVPPTPYDAVEVRLKDKVSGQKRFMTAGSIVGIFRVKPYLTGKWLVGLWIMDDGEIVNEKYGAEGT